MLLTGFLNTLLSAWLTLGMSLNQSLPEFTVSLRDRMENVSLPLGFSEITRLEFENRLDSSRPSTGTSVHAGHCSVSSCPSKRYM